MPPVPANLFADAQSSLSVSLAAVIPGGRGQSLYLRPTMFGLDAHFAVKGSDRFLFVVIASPSDAYFSQAIRVMIERDNCRAASGGTGAVKVGGNYAASLQANQQCIARGFDQSLWLDPETRQNIEDLSAMNFMAVSLAIFALISIFMRLRRGMALELLKRNRQIARSQRALVR